MISVRNILDKQCYSYHRTRLPTGFLYGQSPIGWSSYSGPISHRGSRGCQNGEFTPKPIRHALNENLLCVNLLISQLTVALESGTSVRVDSLVLKAD